MPLPIIDPTTIAVRAARPRPAFGTDWTGFGGLGNKGFGHRCLPARSVQGRECRLAPLTLWMRPAALRRL